MRVYETYEIPKTVLRDVLVKLEGLFLATKINKIVHEDKCPIYLCFLSVRNFFLNSDTKNEIFLRNFKFINVHSKNFLLYLFNFRQHYNISIINIFFNISFVKL